MRLVCPTCHNGMDAPPRLYGQVTACPSCRAPVAIPIPETIPDEPRGPRVLRQPGMWSHPLMWVGIGLGAVAMVVAVVVVLTKQGGGGFADRLDEFSLKTARSQLKVLEQACDTYKLNNETYPPTLDALVQVQPTGGRPILETEKLIDPWGRPYRYDPDGTNNGGLKPDIYFLHPDDNATPIGNWPQD